jgi:hypothetical protein
LVGRTAAAGTGHVDHVVVNQGGGVDHFDHRAQLDGGLGVDGFGSAAGETRAQAGAGRAQAFAAALLQIAADGGDGFDRRHRFDVDGLFHQFQIFAHEIEDLARRQNLVCPLSFHGKSQCNGSDFVGAHTAGRSSRWSEFRDALGGGFAHLRQLLQGLGHHGRFIALSTIRYGRKKGRIGFN